LKASEKYVQKDVQVHYLKRYMQLALLV
jgi:hypothetical protein